MSLQQYKFGFLTYSKRLSVCLLAIGAYVSVQNISDFNKARKIEAMTNVQFGSYLSKLNVQDASTRSLEAIANKALTLSPPDLDTAEKANSRLLQVKSSCLNCQNRIVFIDIAQNDRLTEFGLTALRRSYFLSPYGDEEIMKWRLDLSSEYWENLDEDLKKSALSQITALTQTRENRVWLKNLTSKVVPINSRLDIIQIDG